MGGPNKRLPRTTRGRVAVGEPTRILSFGPRRTARRHDVAEDTIMGHQSCRGARLQ
jgi:hypothetical protein